MNYKKSYHVVVLKMLAVAASLWVIHRQVIIKKDFGETLEHYGMLLGQGRTWAILGLLLVMMAGNWTLEALKWRFLLEKVQRVSLTHAVRAILSGITVSFFTPNRIGEYAGRVLHLKSEIRIKAVIATVVGSMNQLLVTIALGTAAMIFTMQELVGDTPAYWAVSFLMVAGIGLMAFGYYNMSLAYEWLMRFNIVRKAERYLAVLLLYHRKELARITALSLLRYIVFTLQYYLLLELFGLHIGLLPACRQIALVFLVMSVVPTFALTELTVRGSVAVFFLSGLSSNATGIVAASFSLWFINLVIPAVFGAVFLLFIKVFRTAA